MENGSGIAKSTAGPVINFDNYQDAANRTRKSMPDLVQDSVHMCLGIVGEFGELDEAVENQDKPNILEEGGDIIWYVAGECEISGFSFKELVEEVNAINTDVNSETGYDREELHIKDYVDFVKGVYIYKKPADVATMRAFMRYFLFMVKVICQYEANTELQQVLQININKLFVRYGEKYSDFNATNRNLEAEAETLQS